MSSGAQRPFVSVKFSPVGRTYTFLLPELSLDADARRQRQQPAASSQPPAASSQEPAARSQQPGASSRPLTPGERSLSRRRKGARLVP